MKWIINFLEDASGTGAVEYGLIIGLVTLAIISGVHAFGNAVSGLYQEAVAKYPK